LLNGNLHVGIFGSVLAGGGVGEEDAPKGGNKSEPIFVWGKRKGIV